MLASAQLRDLEHFRSQKQKAVKAKVELSKTLGVSPEQYAQLARKGDRSQKAPTAMPAVGIEEDEGNEHGEPSSEPNSDGESEHEYMPNSVSVPIALPRPSPKHPPPHASCSHPFGAAGSAPESRYFGYFNDRVFTPPQGDNSMTHRGMTSYSPAGYRVGYLFDEGTAGAHGTSHSGPYTGGHNRHGEPYAADDNRGHDIPYVEGHDERSGFPYAGEHHGGRRRSQAGGHGRGAAYDQYSMNPSAASQDTDVTMGNSGTQDPASAKKRKNRCSSPPRVHIVEPDIGPLKLPDHNILARSWSKDDRKANEVLTSTQYKKHTTEAVENKANNLRRKRNEKIPIRYAEDTHLNFPELPGQHLDDELKRVADVLFCKGPLQDPYIREILFRKPAVNNSNYNEHRLKLGKRSANAQYHTTEYAQRTGTHPWR
ncbi:hypothetical protein LTR12_000462 [Friedmanniomyces endolithicus]|nr:hypothetical protein LTR74_013643 [Friedmanniomyces endolithicus]KAK1825173.1 hypothetical protein LTR12_000462 [Friedmanniomyces endolithicus]